MLTLYNEQVVPTDNEVETDLSDLPTSSSDQVQVSHKVHINVEYHSVPSLEFGLPNPLSRKRTVGGGGALACVLGVQFPIA